MRYTCLHTVLLAVIFLLSCTRDPEVANNDPDAPQVELEILSRISAEVSIVSTVESSDITYGGEIIQIIDGEEKGVKYSFTTDELDENHRYTWLTENLQPNSTYVARAFITNGRNKKYSASKTYSTPSTSKPTLSSVTQEGELLVASIVDNGGRAIEDVGFVIGDTPDRKELMRKEKIPAAAQTKERFSLPLSSLPGGKTLYIIAYAIDNQKDTGYSSTPIEIFVPQPVSSITLNAKEMTLVEGTSAQLEADVQPENASDKSITWDSSDNEVATVEDGNITAIKEGTAIITATAGKKTASCTVTVTKAFIPVSSISLSQTSLEMVKGEKVTLTVAIEPEDATDKTVSWTSSNDDIITVDNTGMVHAIGGGAARVTAVAGEQSAFCDIVVTVPVSKIKLNPTSCTLEEGQTITLYETIFPEDATDKTVTWESSDVEVATVEDGTVTAIKEGTATITASAGEKSASCTVTVNKKVIAVTSITLDKTELSLTEEESSTLVATVLPMDATDKTVMWNSSDSSVASVSDGTVTAIKEGTATITASAGEKSATCTVTVNKKVIAVTSVTLDLTTLSLTEGETSTLVATVLPTDATDKTVTWSSSDSSVATVSDGTVTAIKEGTATITASAGEKSASCTVTVSSMVTSLSVSPREYSLPVGGSTDLKATVVPSDAPVVWSSSNESVAMVSQTGHVIALSTGECKITASSGNLSADCQLTVIIPVTGITLNENEITIPLTGTKTLIATVLPEDATDKTVNWSSSDESIATVSEDGVVTGVAVGACIITARAGDYSAICNVGVGGIPINEDFFPDSYFRAYIIKSKFDKDGDGVLSDEEIALVDHITLSKSEAQSLAGIEYFVALKYLTCELGELTSLDLSHNTMLSSLNCRENKLTYLNISNNPSLRYLDCENNLISNLDVNNKPLLEYIYCQNNHLTQLDVNGTDSLHDIRCEYNQINSLDLSNRSYLEILYCKNNALCSLIVEGCTSLKTLVCNNNALSSLIVEGCTSLTSIRCSYNNLLTLDLSSCSSLDSVYASYNPNLTEIWLKVGQTINHFWYDSWVTIKYKE